MQLRLSQFCKKSVVLNILTVMLVVTGCSSSSSKKTASQEELIAVYLSEPNTASVDIIFERGHNSHRIYAVHKEVGPEIQIFHDKQIYKSLKIDEGQFKVLLTKSLETASELNRKPATKERSLCRTPFVITVKNSRESFIVEGCRGTEEGTVFGRLVADIEYLASTTTKTP